MGEGVLSEVIDVASCVGVSVVAASGFGAAADDDDEAGAAADVVGAAAEAAGATAVAGGGEAAFVAAAAVAHLGCLSGLRCCGGCVVGGSLSVGLGTMLTVDI